MNAHQSKCAWTRTVAGLVPALAVLLWTFAAVALTPEEIATYNGPDRQKVLEEGARKEGKVAIYSGMIVDQALRPMAEAFEKKYPFLKVDYWRGASPQIIQKALAEARAGKVQVDVLESTSLAPGLVRGGVAQKFHSPESDSYPKHLVVPKGMWASTRLSYFGAAINPEMVKKDEAPKTWDDLLNPKWKGKLVMTDPSFTSLQVSVVGTMAKARGWGFYEKLRANDTMIVQGHQQVSDMLKRGERLIAAEGLDSYAYEDRQKGHKIATLVPSDGVFAVPSPTAIIKGGPNPNAAKAFAAFMIGDTVQKMFPADGHYAARVDMDAPAGNPPLGSLKLLTIDYDRIAKEEAIIKDRFNEIFQ